MRIGQNSKFRGSEDYQIMLPEMVKVRDCMGGAFFVKNKGSLYLPHPSSVDVKSPSQIERYNVFIKNAEYDDFPAVTESVYLGKLKLDDVQANLDSRLEYLIEDCDGDGLSLNGLAESCASNNLRFAYHFLLTDFNGLSDLDIQSLSIDEYRAVNPRATIKQYSRDNVLDYNFNRVNGKMQLTYILLQEEQRITDVESMTEEVITSWLKLGIDESGYYQQKYVSTKKPDELDEGVKNYILVGGKPLQYIPGVFASEREIQGGKLPMKLGYLSQLCDLALSRYRTNACYKEAMQGLQSVVNIYGVGEQEWEEFELVNKRDFVGVGVNTPNIFSNPNVRMEILDTNAAFEPWHQEFEKNTQTVRALGGTFKTDIATQRTATEIINEAENQLAILTPMVDSIEEAIKTCIWYAGVFEGVYSVDTFDLNAIEFTMPRDFATTKLTTEEVNTIQNLFLSGLLSKEEVLKILEIGGWTVSSAEELLTQLTEQV